MMKIIRKLISKMEKMIKWAPIFSNILVVTGIFITYLTYKYTTNLNREQEKRKYTIEAIYKIYNEDFIKKFAIVSECDFGKKDTLDEAFNVVFNTYHILSVMYNYEIGDTLIINKAIKSGIYEFTSKDVYKQYKIKNLESVEGIERMKKSFSRSNN